MTRVALALIALLAACRGDDPYSGGFGGESCLAGSYRDPGPGCTAAPLATVVIDGRADEWQDERLLYPHSASCCTEGDPYAVYVGLDGAGGVAFLIPMIGAAITDGTAIYTIEMRRPGMLFGEVGNVYFELEITPAYAQPYLNGVPVYGIPVEWAFGPGGLEIRLPLDALPYPGESIFAGYVYVLSGGAYYQRNPPAFASLFCWDPNDPTACTLG